MTELGERLLCAASMVRKRTKIVDIGTDHAYLPAYLIINGKADKILACDIGKKPLENAGKTVNQYSLTDKIPLRISDGLKEVCPDEADEIIICGMGGTLMSEILSGAPWIRKEGMHLILQPMTHSEDVRYWLCKNGFRISEEKHIIDNKRVYCCISADYDGEVSDIDKGYCYFGSLPVNDETALAFIHKRLERLDKKINALKNAIDSKNELPELEKIREYYETRMAL